MNYNFEFFSIFDYAGDVFTWIGSEYTYLYSLIFSTIIKNLLTQIYISSILVSSWKRP